MTLIIVQGENSLMESHSSTHPFIYKYAGVLLRVSTFALRIFDSSRHSAPLHQTRMVSMSVLVLLSMLVTNSLGDVSR